MRRLSSVIQVGLKLIISILLWKAGKDLTTDRNKTAMMETLSKREDGGRTWMWGFHLEPLK